MLSIYISHPRSTLLFYSIHLLPWLLPCTRLQYIVKDKRQIFFLSLLDFGLVPVSSIVTPSPGDLILIRESASCYTQSPFFLCYPLLVHFHLPFCSILAVLLLETVSHILFLCLLGLCWIIIIRSPLRGRVVDKRGHTVSITTTF